jgi:hypothetical protein
LSTVRTETTSRSAISRLLDPAAARRAISRSRRVRPTASAAASIVGGRAPSQSVSQRPPRGGGTGTRLTAGVAVGGGSGVRRFDGQEQRARLREALGDRQQRGPVAGDERGGVRGRGRGERPVDVAGEPRELRRGGRRIAQPAELVQRADRVGVLAAGSRERARVAREHTRTRELAARGGAPRSGQLKLDREALVPQRRALHLRDRAARRLRLAGLRRGLGDAREREGQHPDGVAVTQERGALAAEAQRRPDPPSRELEPGLTLFAARDEPAWEPAAASLAARLPVGVRFLDPVAARAVGAPGGSALLARSDGTPVGVLGAGSDPVPSLRAAVAAVAA